MYLADDRRCTGSRRRVRSPIPDAALDLAMRAQGVQAEWADVRRDLDALQAVVVRDGEERHVLRTPLRGAWSLAVLMAWG